MTCEEKARESSVCPKQGVCHPRFFWSWQLSMELIILTVYTDGNTQLLWSLGGAWKGQSMWVASILEWRQWQCSRRRRKDKSKVRRGDFHAWRLSTQFNETPNSSCSTRMQAQVGPKSLFQFWPMFLNWKEGPKRPSNKSEGHKCLKYR